MKRIFLILTFALILSPFAFTVSAQSRTNRLTRPCSGSTTPATVSIAVGGNITATPCSGGTVTINGVAISSTNSATILRSYLATTVTYNNTAALADTALSVTVAAGGTYEIELVVHSESGIGTRLKLDFGGTATHTNFIGEWLGHPADDYAIGYSDRVTAANTAFIANGNTENAPSYWAFKGTVEINAGGTFLLRGAQSAATAVNTTIIRGSTLKLTKLN